MFTSASMKKASKIVHFMHLCLFPKVRKHEYTFADAWNLPRSCRQFSGRSDGKIASGRRENRCVWVSDLLILGENATIFGEFSEFQAMTMDMIGRSALGLDLACIKVNNSVKYYTNFDLLYHKLSQFSRFFVRFQDRDNDFYKHTRVFFSNMRLERSLLWRTGGERAPFHICSHCSIFDSDQPYRALKGGILFLVAVCTKVNKNLYYSAFSTFASTFETSRNGRSWALPHLFYVAVFFPIVRFLRPFSTYGRAERVIIKEISAVIHQREKERDARIVSVLSAKTYLNVFLQTRPIPDVIDLILNENDKRLETGVSDVRKIRLRGPLQRTLFHHDIIVSNAWAMFIAGYETTSSALSYASFLLGKHPEVWMEKSYMNNS